MKITLIQFDIAWENIQANLDKLDGLINPVENNDLIVLPEMFTTGFTMNAEEMAETMDGPGVTAMKNWARSKDMLIMGSLIIKEDGKFFNRMVSAHPDGTIQTYDKRHLFTFAGEDKHFSPGSETIEVVNYKGWRILPQICYDVRFPVFPSYRDDIAYDMMVYVANFPNKRISAWNHLLRARAIENQAYVIGVNRWGLDGLGNYYNGDSQFIDYSGKYLVRLGPGEWVEQTEADLDSLNKFRRNFPFLEDRDRP